MARRPLRTGRTSGKRRPGRQIHAEGSEDGQVEKAGGHHDSRVLAFPEGRPGQGHQGDRGHRARHPEPTKQAVVAVVDGAVQY